MEGYIEIQNLRPAMQRSSSWSNLHSMNAMYTLSYRGAFHYPVSNRALRSLISTFPNMYIEANRDKWRKKAVPQPGQLLSTVSPSSTVLSVALGYAHRQFFLVLSQPQKLLARAGKRD